MGSPLTARERGKRWDSSSCTLLENEGPGRMVELGNPVSLSPPRQRETDPSGLN